MLFLITTKKNSKVSFSRRIKEVIGEAGKEVDYTDLKCIPRKFTGV